MLTKMLEESGSLDKMTPPNRAITYALAHEFQKLTDYLFKDELELLEVTGIGTKDQWTQLLKMQETQNYIKGSMAFISQIAQRKTFASLVEQALTGNAAAAKQVQELSGIMNRQDSNKVIIMHHIPRPISTLVPKEEIS